MARPFMQAMNKSHKESQSQFSKKWRISEIAVRDLRSDVSGQNLAIIPEYDASKEYDLGVDLVARGPDA